MQEIRVALPGQGTAATRAALPIPVSVCSIFMCPNNGMADSIGDFLMCMDMLIRAMHTGAVRTR